MTHAVCIQQFGGPETLQWAAVEVGTPGPRDARIRQTVVGVNFADVYMRSGNHPAAIKFPAILGIEGAGIVEAIGSEVHEVAVGDRIAYFGALGAYSEIRLVPADRLIKLPPSVEDRVAAAMLAKGVTAQYLCRQVFQVKAADVVLVHAAAGGVGLILSQWSAALGATVIGTVGSDEKAEIAKANGCTHTIVSTREDFVSRVTAITEGQKATVVFDSLGGSTTVASLDCLRARGTLVIFGRTTGYPAPINPIELMHKGSLIVTMTQLANFAKSRQDIEAGVRDLFAMLDSGRLKPHIGQQYALRNAAQAHRDLESRKTIGSTVLVV
jgi:NADPH:quinone reductase